MELDSSEMAEYVSPEQLAEQLITLSLLPDSRWKNLLHLDVIKVCVHNKNLYCAIFNKKQNELNYFLFFPQKRNKPKQPPKLPKAAPFFIPTIPGLVPQFAVPDTTTEEQVSALSSL